LRQTTQVEHGEVAFARLRCVPQSIQMASALPFDKVCCGSKAPF
jgi:hypothetical protein